MKNEYVLFLQHPVTTEKNSYEQMIESLEALQNFGKDVILIYPNPDPGSKKMLKAIRDFSKKYNGRCVIKNKFKNLPFESFINLLANSFCLVGNSSCGITEAYTLKKYVVDIGTRQNSRERSENVFNVSYSRESILDVLKDIEQTPSFPKINQIYGDGNSSKKIVSILESIDLEDIVNKRLAYDI